MDEHDNPIRWIILGTILLVSLVGLILLVLCLEKGTSTYYRANNGLFLSIIVVSILIIGGKEKTWAIIRKAIRFIKSYRGFSLYDYGDLLLLVSYLVAIFSFLFILDLSFLKNYGIRISAVVGVTLVKLLKDLVFSRFR